MEEYMNPILQSLCADALLSISDEDSDWELNITEFTKCLDPGLLKKDAFKGRFRRYDFSLRL